MDRDTEEWLRPWRDDATVTARASVTVTDEVTHEVTDEAEADVVAPRVAVRRTRLVRPTPSTIAAVPESPQAPTPAPTQDETDEAEAPAVAEAPVLAVPVARRVVVRPDAPGALTSTQPVPMAPPPLAPDVDANDGSDTADVEADTGDGGGGPVVVAFDTGGPAPVEPPKRGRGPLGLALAAGLVGALVGTGGTLVAADRLGLVDAPVASAPGESSPQRAPVVETREVATGETVVAAVASAVLPSVVRIDVLADDNDPDLGAVQVPVGVGSGVIYRSDGYILTNNHVVKDADAVVVQFSDGRQEPAEIVGTDPLTDLAVLKVDLDDLVAVNLRADVPLQVGETAVAIGSPFGLDASVTAGVVSALNRDLEVPGDAGSGAFVIPALIQTDAAINPGNSGGALVDANGRLIGINTAILTGSGGSQGVGFAIPTGSAVIAADQLIARGFVSHPFLGISGLDVTNEVAARYREEFGIDLSGGALVDQVVDGSGAQVGGVRKGDVIVSIGGQPIGSMTDVIGAILRFDTDATVEVVVLRDGDRQELEVTLGERPR